ncbi:MAG: Lon-like protease helical domain-containing protein, partial [Sphingomonadales bacterium]
MIQPLAADKLHRSTDLSHLTFATTAELEPIDGLASQTRALEAVQFGTQVEKTGFNLFVIGPNGARMQDAVKAILEVEARNRAAPSDWVYVNNFADPARPTALELPAGRAPKFEEAMHKLIDDLQAALPAVFQSEDYQTR